MCCTPVAMMAVVLINGQHDPETHECSPGGELGNYIMFARATSGDKPNNNKFSLCSQVSMALVMEAKARHTAGCFIAPTTSICGNEVVEFGEECDCGWEDECREKCCVSQKSGSSHGKKPCTRKKDAKCSPSQGPCCTSDCQYVSPGSNKTCREATPCKDAAYCKDQSAMCPPSQLKADKTPCNDGYVCYRGECTGSICMAYELESCQCEPEDRSNFRHPDLCKLCCKFPGEGSTCRSSFEWNDPDYDVPDQLAKPGSPCNDYKGYCDVFHTCREVDPSGPLAHLKRFFSGEGMASLKEWLETYWYVVLAAGLLLLILLVLFIRLCAPRKKDIPVAPIKHHDEITPVAHAPPLPHLYSTTQCATGASKPLLDNLYKHSTATHCVVAPATPSIPASEPSLQHSISLRPSEPFFPMPPITKKTPPIRRPAPSPPLSANRKYLISRTNQYPAGKKFSQSEGWV